MIRPYLQSAHRNLPFTGRSNPQGSQYDHALPQPRVKNI
jgi:hypothetical protein